MSRKKQEFIVEGGVIVVTSGLKTNRGKNVTEIELIADKDYILKGNVVNFFTQNGG